MKGPCDTSDLLVFSHLRWDFVFQRPQHLLTRHAKYRRVFYVEESILGMTDIPRLHLRETAENVLVVIPYLPSNLSENEKNTALIELMDELIYEEEIIDFTIMYYAPMALSFTKQLDPKKIIFDCVDEHSHFSEPSQIIDHYENELLKKADIVFAAGNSLFESKKHKHHNIHAFPSSIDYSHFAQARGKLIEPDDQKNIPHPRIGFYGVIDNRFNLDLLLQIADLAPHYQFIIIGPVLKIDPRTLPQRRNIHYLGKKDYHTLPLYLSSWSCAIMPFALNKVTRFISPTKTLEYLAAGKPIVSTSITDVVNPYGHRGLARIADRPEDFIDEIDLAIEERKLPEWLDRVDHYLKDYSWDKTFSRMAEIELRENEISFFIKSKNEELNIRN